MARKPSGTKISDHAAARKDVNRVAAMLSMMIMIVGGIVFLIFTAISIRDIRFDNIPAFFGVTTFTKFGLGLFFGHWGWGVKIDLHLQASYYHADPNRGQLTPRSWIGIVGFNLFFVALFWWHTEIVVFQAILLGLIIMNFYSWAAIIAQSNRMAASSRKDLERNEDWFALEQLNLVCDYMNGRWQKIRFVVLIACCLLQVVAAVALAGWWEPLDGARAALESLFGPELLPHVPGLLFFVYVLLSSAWMAFMRLRVLSQTRVIDKLIENYVMERRTPRRKPRKPRRQTAKAA